MSALVPRTTGIALFRNPRIPVSRGNPSSYVWAIGNGSKLPVLPELRPKPELGLDDRSLVPEPLKQ